MAVASPLIMVIFGATGDLMHRKLMPALYHLAATGEVSRNIYIVGVGRREIDRGMFQERMEKSLTESFRGVPDHEVWKNITDHMYYVEGTFEDENLYKSLTALLTSIDKDNQACVQRFFYLATPPEHYETILMQLSASKLSEGCGQGTSFYTRILIEKPFGKDLLTARALDRLLGTIFEERQIYRIDHYLGKETVQNILSLRFANGIFEPTWNAKFIDHVQITLAENSGVGTRGAFYDGVGTLRDVVQNHMLEMLAVIAMDQPRAFDAESIRDERVKIIESVRCIEAPDAAESVVRGQYDRYTAEPGVSPRSITETYVALKLFVDTPRWRGVPFYLRAGKMLPRKTTVISIHFKKPVVCLAEPDPASQDTGNKVCLFPEPDVRRDVLTIRIEPDEGIVLRLMAKKPGYGMKLSTVTMNFTYKDAFSGDSQPMAYEKLLLDAIQGDQTLFSRTDGIEASWTLITKILDAWKGQSDKPIVYEPGTWGPEAASDLLIRDGKHWYLEGE